MTTRQDGAITARDGANLTYTLRSAGGDAPRVALIHSLALDRSVWDMVVARLGDVSVLTYDCRGHGASSTSAGSFSLELFANDLADLFAAIGWDAASVAGSSMGGCVGQQFAIAYPQRTLGLGLIDTTAWYGPDAPKNWEERAVKAQAEGLQALIAFQETRWFSAAFRSMYPDLVAAANAIFLRNDVPSYVATCRMLGNFDLRVPLGSLAAPTEILVGEHDYATPVAMARGLAETIAGSHLQIVPEARHLTTLEVPEAVATMIRRAIHRGAAVADRR